MKHEPKNNGLELWKAYTRNMKQKLFAGRWGELECRTIDKCSDCQYKVLNTGHA